ncbi:MAG TPA: family 43 glycosylhydrolase [Pyrinomonadaceae bacterium]|nr:family 43 glycosylhydrolase [Pyrinomonadaceae bacterium]
MKEMLTNMRVESVESVETVKDVRRASPSSLRASVRARVLLRRAMRAVVLVAALFASILAVSPDAAAQRRATYANPVAAGDFPDPSVIRVGGDYWAVATSSEWGPEFPILRSRDLVNWDAVGTVFDARPAWSVGNYWAPEISQHNGRFYVYYTARKKDGPLCVAVATARRPQGPYRDHGPLVCQEVGSIDGFPVTDERGRRYLLWKEDGNSVQKPTPIWAQRLSNDGTRLVGERQEILRNTEPWEKHATLPYGDLIEGPAVVRRGGWFYMFYSGNFCCARECNYMMGVARARSLLGPWEKHARNPILKGNDNWKCPGHGTVVSDAQGRDWLLYHAMDAKDFVYVGRQALLDEVTWGRDGWPVINGGRGPSARADAPRGARASTRDVGFYDEFTTPRLRPGWQWPHALVPVMRVDTRRQGWLVLSPDASRPEAPPIAVVARSTTTGDYEATTVVETGDLTGGAAAGLSAFGDMENALGVSVGDGKVILWRREKNEQRLVETEDAPAGARLHLRMRARDGRRYRFAYSRDGRDWRDLGGEVDGEYLPPWDRGVRVALVAGGRAGAQARFGFLRVEPSR